MSAVPSTLPLSEDEKSGPMDLIADRAAIVPREQRRLQAYATSFANTYQPGEEGYADPKALSWREVKDLPLSNLGAEIRAFSTEQFDVGYEDDPSYYRAMKSQPIKEPVVLVKKGDQYYVWDGHHRIGGAFLAGRKTIPAVIGEAQSTGPIDLPVSVGPTVASYLAANAPVAIGVSGGKDSSAVALRTIEYLDKIGHNGPRLLVHSDLGEVEWAESLPLCERLAQRLNMELLTVRRASGGLMERWEQRWRANVQRYANLECVKLVLPWSTPSMRFCTSELKTDVISRALRARWPSGPVISVLGIRAAESPSRAKMPIEAPATKLMRKNSPGVVWHPIHTWSTPEVFAYLESRQEPLHEAYTKYKASRVSCAFCIMGAESDLMAASKCEENATLYRRMVRLESTSTFAFQGSRWLADVAPHLLSPAEIEASQAARSAGSVRIHAESRISKGLLYESGWPVRVPTTEEATNLASIRQTVAKACGFEISYTTADSIVERFDELLRERLAREAGKKPVIEIFPAETMQGTFDKDGDVEPSRRARP